MRVRTSWVTLAETGAALAAARRSRRVSRAAATTANRLLTEHRLRGADGIHLATALPIRDAGTVFVTFDTQLARAARAEGFAVLT